MDHHLRAACRARRREDDKRILAPTSPLHRRRPDPEGVDETVQTEAVDRLSARTLHEVSDLVVAVTSVDRHAEEATRRTGKQQPDVVRAIRQSERNPAPRSHTLFA